MTISYDSTRWGTNEAMSYENIMPGAVINTTDSPHKSINSLIPRLDGVNVAGTVLAAHPGHDHRTRGRGANVNKSFSIGDTGHPCAGLDFSDFTSVGQTLKMDNKTYPLMLIAPPPGCDTVDVYALVATSFSPGQYGRNYFQFGLAYYNTTNGSVDDGDYSSIVWSRNVSIAELPITLKWQVPLSRDTGMIFGRYYCRWISSVGSSIPGDGNTMTIYQPAMYGWRKVR